MFPPLEVVDLDLFLRLVGILVAIEQAWVRSLDRILLLTTLTLGALCCATGGVLVRRRLRTGTTMLLLPLLRTHRLRFPAEAPSDECARTGTACATAATA